MENKENRENREKKIEDTENTQNTQNTQNRKKSRDLLTNKRVSLSTNIKNKVSQLLTYSSA